VAIVAEATMMKKWLKLTVAGSHSTNPPERFFNELN